MHFIFRDGKNNPLTEVWVSRDKRTVKYKNYTDDVLMTCFGSPGQASYEDVLGFFKERCFQKNRSNLADILKTLHMKTYDPYVMCRKLQGRMNQDSCWVDFMDD